MDSFDVDEQDGVVGLEFVFLLHRLEGKMKLTQDHLLHLIEHFLVSGIEALLNLRKWKNDGH